MKNKRANANADPFGMTNKRGRATTEADSLRE
jgi:hypothetical protein